MATHAVQSCVLSPIRMAHSHSLEITAGEVESRKILLLCLKYSLMHRDRHTTLFLARVTAILFHFTPNLESSGAVRCSLWTILWGPLLCLGNKRCLPFSFCSQLLNLCVARCFLPSMLWSLLLGFCDTGAVCGQETWSSKQHCSGQAGSRISLLLHHPAC